MAATTMKSSWQRIWSRIEMLAGLTRRGPNLLMMRSAAAGCPPLMMLCHEADDDPNPQPRLCRSKYSSIWVGWNFRFRPVLMQPILPSFTHVYRVSGWQLRRVAV